MWHCMAFWNKVKDKKRVYCNRSNCRRMLKLYCLLVKLNSNVPHNTRTSNLKPWGWRFLLLFVSILCLFFCTEWKLKTLENYVKHQTQIVLLCIVCEGTLCVTSPWLRFIRLQNFNFSTRFTLQSCMLLWLPNSIYVVLFSQNN